MLSQVLAIQGFPSKMPNRGNSVKTVAITAIALVGSGAILLAGLPAPAVARPVMLTHSTGIESFASSEQVRSSYGVRIDQAPKFVRIGNKSSRSCQGPVTLAINGPRLTPGDSLAVEVRFRIPGVEPTLSVDFREDLKPGRTYRLFPYPEPEYGPNYTVSFCGSIVSGLSLQSLSPGKFKAYMDVSLYRSVGVKWTKLAAYSHEFRLDWRGLSG